MVKLFADNIPVEPVTQVSYQSPNWENYESVVEIYGPSSNFRDMVAVGRWARVTDGAGDERMGLVTRVEEHSDRVTIHIKNEGLS